MVVCSVCGAEVERADGPDEPLVPLGWMVERDPRTRRVTTVCGGCARRHARSIEGKLDQAWW